MKPPKKQEEKEKKGKGRALEDELKDSLADDDSSSTTTETSNPDTEPLLKEVGQPRGAGWAQSGRRECVPFPRVRVRKPADKVEELEIGKLGPVWTSDHSGS